RGCSSGLLLERILSIRVDHSRFARALLCFRPAYSEPMRCDYVCFESRGETRAKSNNRVTAIRYSQSNFTTSTPVRSRQSSCPCSVPRYQCWRGLALVGGGEIRSYSTSAPAPGRAPRKVASSSTQSHEAEDHAEVRLSVSIPLPTVRQRRLQIAHSATVLHEPLIETDDMKCCLTGQGAATVLDCATQADIVRAPALCRVVRRGDD